MKKVAWWTAVGALFIIPFIPLYVADGMYFPFITGKGFAFRILVEIALCGWVVLALADKRYRPRFSWTFALYGAFTLWMLIADLFAVNAHKALWSNFERMDGWVTLVHVFLFFVVASSVLSVDKLWRKWWLTFLGAGAVVCGYGLFQMMGLLTIHQGGVRADATFGNAEYLAAYLLFVIGIALWQAMESKEWMRYALYALSALGVIILFATGTRGAFLGLVGAAVLGSVLWMIEAGKKTRGVAVGVLLALIVLVGSFFLIKDTPFIQNDPTLTRIANISLSDGSTRFTLWHMAVEGLMERPVTGWGQEGFNYVFNKFYDPSLYTQEAWFDRAHNVYVDWLIAGGIPALLLFLALLISAVVALYKSNVSRAERIALLSVLAAYGFQALFVFDNLFTYVPLAALLAAAHLASSRPIKRLEELPEVEAGRIDTVALPVAGVAAILLIVFVNVPNVRAAGDLVRAISPASDPSVNTSYFQKALSDNSYATQEIREQMVYFAANAVSGQTAPSEATASLMQLALSEMGKEVAAAPKDARLRIEYALGYRAAGDYKDALVQVASAHELSPNKQTILIEQGTEEWQAGDTASAKKSFDAAYALSPSIQGLAAYAAVGDIITGDRAAAKAILEQAYGTTTADDDILLLAYYRSKDYDDLIAALKARIAKGATDVQTMFNLAAAYEEAERIPEARAQIQATIQVHPEAATEGYSFLNSLPK